VGWTGLRYKIKVEFQDVLALMIVVPFLVFTILVMLGEHSTEILRIYVPLISIVLGGYFGQGAIREWQRGDPKSDRPLDDSREEPPI